MHRSWSRGAFLLLACTAPLAAQPTFSTIIVQDRVPLDLAPRAENVMSEGSVFVTRACLSPAARQRLARGLGFEGMMVVDEAAAGPVVFGANDLSRIPGDRRLRCELGAGIALHVLGLGASVEESLAAVRDEPLPRGILIGVHPDAPLPDGCSRVGSVDARPVVWTWLVDYVKDFSHGERRKFIIMDDWPHTDGRYSAFITGLHENPGLPQGPYPQHLQGIASDPAGNLYWSWTDRLTKTDARGAVLASIEVSSHHGDLTWHDGHVVVATNHGKFNDLAGAHDSWLYVYGDETLELLGKHALPQCRYGAGGVCWAVNRYVVVGGLPVELEKDPVASNEVHEYDAQFNHLRTTRLDGGWTRLGIQTAAFAYGRFIFGCYGEPKVVLVASPDLRHVRRTEGFDCAYGVTLAPCGMLFIGRDERRDDGHHGTVDLGSPSWLGQ